MSSHKPGIFVVTPAYGGMIYHGCVLSLIKLERACVARGLSIDFQVVANESLISRARNGLAHIFLAQTSYSHLLFIDADIEFDAEDILKMYDTDLPLIGGVYPKKQTIKNPNDLTAHSVIVLDTNTQPPSPPTQTTPFPVKYIGTGLMMIKRDVLIQMINHGIPKYLVNTEEHHAFFDTCIDDKKNYLSEDYYFCEMWRRLGGVVYAALWVRCTHWGTFGFTTS